MLDKKLIIVLLDNRGYGCINRLQQHCGSKPFNNMLEDCLQYGDGAPNIDFAANAASLPRRSPISPSSRPLSSGREQPSAPI